MSVVNKPMDSKTVDLRGNRNYKKNTKFCRGIARSVLYKIP